MNIGVFFRWMSSRENTNKRFVHSPNDRLFQKTTARSKVVDGSGSGGVLFYNDGFKKESVK